MAILVLGFQPFDGLKSNPSEEVARALSGDDVVSEVLPVEYRAVDHFLEQTLPGEWDAVVLLGLARKRGHITPEKIAVNARDTERADESDFVPETDSIVEGGPAAYFSTLPNEVILKTLDEAGHLSQHSDSAGTFVCNHAFYRARHHIGNADIPCGFIHLPPTPDLDPDVEGIPLTDLLDAMKRTLDVIRDHLRDR